MPRAKTDLLLESSYQAGKLESAALASLNALQDPTPSMRREAAALLMGPIRMLMQEARPHLSVNADPTSPLLGSSCVHEVDGGRNGIVTKQDIVEMPIFLKLASLEQKAQLGASIDREDTDLLTPAEDHEVRLAIRNLRRLIGLANVLFHG